MRDGFIKIAAATPDLHAADCAYNTSEIVKLAKEAAAKGAKLITFPELCLTGYTCGDLFLQETLLEGALKALGTVCRETAELQAVIVVGLPMRFNGKLYNIAAPIVHGRVLAFVPKTHIPNYSEFYEQRHFCSGRILDDEGIEAKNIGVKTLNEEYNYIHIGNDFIFQCDEQPLFTFGVEICEDLWVPNPPSTALAQMGAHIIVNLSASDEIIGKAGYRRDLVRQQSGRLLCAYLYADAGFGESTQDLVFAGHDLIAENGALLAESKMFSQGIIYADIDLQRLAHERQRMNTFEPVAGHVQSFSLAPVENDLADRTFPRTPFVPANKALRDERCEEILTLQATGLATRLRHTHAKTAVVGLSGGLDSTLALIVLVHAFDMLELDRKGILAVTMPCFGTTARTKGNAEKLAEAYGVTLQTVDIKAAVDQHFMDIGQSKDDLSVTFENGQARMRTLVLMNLANKNGGMVVGTGDLSELALGWATYNGDHMSMYGVNGSIPKTLVRYLVAYEADRTLGELSDVLQDVLDTPVSPELLPPKDGEISQKTEDLVGPYELHDFFLYYMLRFGYPPRKIFRAAHKTFEGVYDNATIKKWLTTFMRRFFTQQFKRSCLPDGPKVGTVTLSPRGDWRMPSDAVSALWLKEAESL
ncbi:MAG: NAD(+) synthase [Agathobaculum butyriciproducens]|nr:NAD(+) synthase [Butyricicoccus sp. BIOML-A1]MEE0154250.1 NAD(+) synthase [Agathobaculum butyriciproducens]MZT25383.1 NAD(+) synthase [Butyricicoccus sp. BIOML-A1]